MRTVPSFVFLPETSAGQRTRPAPAIVAKDTTPYVESLSELPDGDVLVVETPGFAEPPGRLLRRSGRDLALVAELPGVNSHAVCSPDKTRLLAAGPLRGGQEASCLIVDLAAWKITRTLPVMRPFVWLDDTRFIAQSPRWKTPGTRDVDPVLAAAEPWMRDDVHGMVVVDLDANTTRPLLEARLLDEEHAGLVDPSSGVLYTATSFSRISATRVSDGHSLWQRPPVPTVLEGSTSAIVRDPTGRELYVLGSGPRDLVRLDLVTGRQLATDRIGTRIAKLGLPDHHRLGVAARREDGLVVIGTDKGVLIEQWPDGRWEAHKIASRAIQALAFIRGGTQLLAGGAERNLRLVRYD
jgi:hypothetical protein